MERIQTGCRNLIMIKSDAGNETVLQLNNSIKAVTS